MLEAVGLAASLITLAAALRGCHDCMRALENSTRKATAESRQLRELYRTINTIAKGLDNGTLLACEKTCDQVSASLQKANRLLRKFRKSTAFLRIDSARWAKVGWTVGIRSAVKKLCGKIRYCCTNTKVIIYEMERLSKRVSKLELKYVSPSKDVDWTSEEGRGKPKPAQEEAESQDMEEPTQEGSEPAHEKAKQPRERKKRTKRTPTKHEQRNTMAWTVGGALIGAAVGGIIGLFVGGSWTGAAIGGVAGGVVGGWLGNWFSS